jgi:hypothetical protein
MATTQQPSSFLSKALVWGLSIFQKIERRTVAARDARLRSYWSVLSWKDNKALDPNIKIVFDKIYAESEQHARELSQAQAIKEKPVLTSKLSDKQIVPPYMTDPAATLARWELGEAPLNDEERELSSKGELGPARTVAFHVEATIG